MKCAMQASYRPERGTSTGAPGLSYPGLFDVPLNPVEQAVVQKTQIEGAEESDASVWRVGPTSRLSDSEPRGGTPVPPEIGQQPEGRHARAARSVIRWKCKARGERGGHRIETMLRKVTPHNGSAEGRICRNFFRVVDLRKIRKCGTEFAYTPFRHCSAPPSEWERAAPGGAGRGKTPAGQGRGELPARATRRGR